MTTVGRGDLKSGTGFNRREFLVAGGLGLGRWG